MFALPLLEHFTLEAQLPAASDAFQREFPLGKIRYWTSREEKNLLGSLECLQAMKSAVFEFN